MRRRRVALGLAALAALGTLAFGLHVGWLRAPRPWQEATGWDRIPLAERAGFALRWDGAAGEAPVLDWLGHAGFLVRWHGARILLDPNLSDFVTLSPRRMERLLDAAALGAVDAVLISHAHYDHLDDATLAALPAVGALVVPKGSEGFVSGVRRDARIVGLAPGERARFGQVEVIAVPAAHNGNRYHPLASTYQANGYVLRAGADAIYVAGDTGRRNDFEAIAREHHLRLAILPIGAYSPSFPLRRYHLSPEDAVEVAQRLGVSEVVPYHFGTFVLSLDRPDAALPRFAHAARAAGLAWTMPRLAGPADAAAGAPGNDP